MDNALVLKFIEYNR